MTGLYVTLGAVVLLLTSHGTAIYYARKAEREKIHRWLEAHAREVSEDVNEILGQPLGSDAELLARVSRKIDR